MGEPLPPARGALHLVSLRDVDEPGAPCDTRGQGALLTEAIAMADAGWTQEEIMAELQQQFPGKPAENYYLNPAAVAVMRRMVRERERRQGQEVDRARLRAKGLPEHLADRPLAGPAPAPPAAAGEYE